MDYEYLDDDFSDYSDLIVEIEGEEQPQPPPSTHPPPQLHVVRGPLGLTVPVSLPLGPPPMPDECAEAWHSFKQSLEAYLSSLRQASEARAELVTRIAAYVNCATEGPEN